MFINLKSDPLSQQRSQLILILLAYVIFALLFGLAYRFKINVDGIAYLRLAGYIAEGNFQQSVSGTWAPLFTWLLSPFLLVGLDGLTSARIAIALSGAGLLLSSWLLTSRFDLDRTFRFFTVLAAGLLIADWSVRNIGPDLLISALILFYLYLASDPSILKHKRAAFFCGVAGGLAYFAKHYAFWFFIVHFPVMLLLRGYIERQGKRIRFKKILLSWVIGMIGLLLVSSIWITVLSAKFGHLTITPVGNLVYAKLGPTDVDRRDPSFTGGLNRPSNPYSIHSWEDPEEIKEKYKTWSPFENKAYFMHQLRMIRNNLVYIFGHFVNFSPFFTYFFVTAILALIPIALLINPLDRKTKFLTGFIVLSFGAYSSGHILTFARTTKYFYPLMLLAIFSYSFFLGKLESGIRATEVVNISARRKKVLTVYLLLILILSFTIKPGIHLLKSVKNLLTIEQVNPYLEIAEKIDAAGFPSPYAIIRSSQKPHTDLYIAYYLQKQLTGRPLSSDPDGITEELRAAGAKSLLVFDNPEMVEALKRDGRYIHKARIRLGGNKRYEDLININIFDHEIITGWDSEVNIFVLKQPRFPESGFGQS